MDTYVMQPIMAATDFSADGNAAVAYAADQAARTRRLLIIVHVARFEPPTGPVSVGRRAIRRLLDEAGGRLDDLAAAASRDHPNLAVTVTVVVGDPVDVLVDRACGAFALVIGARRRSGDPALRWGSVGSRLVSRAFCPVFIVRAGAGGRAPRAGGPVVVAGAARATTAFAISLKQPEPAYVLALRPGRTDLSCGGLPTERLVIQVAAAPDDLVAATARAAADYGAGLVVFGRNRHTWPFRIGAGSSVHELVDAVDCPVVIVDVTAPILPPVPARQPVAVIAHA